MPNANVGVLLDVVFEVVGLDPAHLDVIPIAIIKRPLDVPRFRNFLEPVLSARPEPRAPLPLSHFAELVSQFLSHDAEFFSELSDFI